MSKGNFQKYVEIDNNDERVREARRSAGKKCSDVYSQSDKSLETQYKDVKYSQKHHA
mgnify:FL=1